MNLEQIKSLIEKNKVDALQIKDYSGGLLTRIEAKSPMQAIKELEEVLPDFAAYRKLEITGKKGGANAPWTNGYKWSYEFDNAVAKSATGIAAVPPGTISPHDYVAMFTAMMDKNLEATRETMKAQNELFKNQLISGNKDPEKWLPIIRELGPVLGLKMGGISGPPKEKKDLHFGDVNTSKMTEEEIEEAIAMRMVSLSKKIKGLQFLDLIISINENPKIKDQVEGLTIMLQAIAKDSSLYDMAMKHIK